MSDLEYAGGRTRLFVEAPLDAGVRVTPDAAQAHYLLHVMRAKAGGRVLLFNGCDGEWLARIAEITKRGCALVCERQTAAQNKESNLWLCFAPIKKTPADYVVQKATELGVSVLQPVFTRRTIVSRVNEERMRANAVEAAEQSGRTTVPEIRNPQKLEAMLRGWPAGRRLIFCDEAGDAPPLAQALQGFPPPPMGGGKARGDLGEGEGWAILTGPEGGFDAAEREMLRAKPFMLPVSLGPRILRADTAALAALAVWQAIKSDGAA